MTALILVALASFAAGLIVGAYRSAPTGEETDDGFVLSE